MRNAVTFLIASLILVELIFCQQFVPQQVLNVPGYVGNKVNFKQYSGHVPVNATTGRYLFYWFVQSQNDPANDPVLLWLNGGPGCSSLDGFVTEHGPYRLESDGKTVTENPWAWNKKLNIIYLESPFEVGYTFSLTKDLVWNDVKSANDVVTALTTLLGAFPQFIKNDFYIAAESYGGHYSPTTAVNILEANQQNRYPFKINLKGFIVANGVMDDEADTNTTPLFMYQHSLISKQQYDEGYSKCKGDFYKNQNDPACSNVITEYFNQIVGVNPYFLYGECEGDFTPFLSENNKKLLVNRKISKFKRLFNTHPLFGLSKLAVVMDDNENVPCLAYKPQEHWFNLEEVKTALHVSPLMPKDHQWKFCNPLVGQYYNTTYTTMVPFYKTLLQNGIRGLFYSGDCDLSVQSLGSQLSINKVMDQMRANIIKEFGTWTLKNDKQIAGFYQVWNAGRTTFTFKTIKGAGHMTPMMKPIQSQAAVFDFIFGN
ncbi:hypothetical protein ABK040_009397 [Willaertia magna]